jgi:hypothetical protein
VVSNAAAEPVFMPNTASSVSRDEKPQGASLVGQLRDKAIALIARARGAGDVKDLADLPKLRNRDIHPDAPARQPILAHRDFGGFHETAMQLDEVALPQASANARPPFVIPAAAAEVVEVVEEVAPVAYAPLPPFAETSAPTFTPNVSQEQPQEQPYEQPKPEPANLAQMVNRLEAVLASRQAQLQQLEDIAQRALAQSEARDNAVAQAQPASSEPHSETMADDRAEEPVVERRLEAVETTGAAINRPRNGDDALRSALETLHRMNARSN